MEANLKTAEQSYKALRLHLSLNMNLTIQQNHELLVIPEEEEELDLRPSSSVPPTSPNSSIPYKINPSDMNSFIKEALSNNDQHVSTDELQDVYLRWDWTSPVSSQTRQKRTSSVRASRC